MIPSTVLLWISLYLSTLMSKALTFWAKLGPSTHRPTTCSIFMVISCSMATTTPLSSKFGTIQVSCHSALSYWSVYSLKVSIILYRLFVFLSRDHYCCQSLLLFHLFDQSRQSIHFYFFIIIVIDHNQLVNSSAI